MTDAPPAPPLADGPPRDPEAAGGERRRSEAWALLAAALVLLAGAALGAAGFTFEQHFLVWHPTVTRVAGGWRVAGQPGLPVGAPVVRGDHLAWSQGPYISVLNLGSGKTTVIDVNSVGAEESLGMSARYVAWLRQNRNGSSALWAYDTVRGRRWQVAAQPSGAPSFGEVAVAGNLLATFAASGSRIVGIDLASGRRSVLASGVQTDLPPLLGDHVVGWVLPAALAGVSSASVCLKDLRNGRTTTLELAPAGSGLRVADVQLAGRRLLWLQQGAGSSRATVFAYNVDSAATTTVAQGSILDPVLGSDFIAWIQPAPAGRGASLIGRHLAAGLGPAFVLARVASGAASIAVSGRQIAWLAEAGPGGVAYIQTGTVRQ